MNIITYHGHFLQLLELIIVYAFECNLGIIA